ncbi:class I SAM-dependent methyltransferase [Amycolatopsis sp. lyj-109]|uniref:class I SAM-dependent methyltransferase n=1 Tax=Amycolatopsis sp. lyj-109 TaxID=2789287 RepID=UPI003978C7DF
MSDAGFAAAYRGAPPWEIGRPQPAVVALAGRGGFAGRVLDVGCGTGENTLYLAGLGHPVLGIDGTPAAIERARSKASQRGSTAEFAVADAFGLAALHRRFDVALDSAFLHVLSGSRARRAYIDQLAAVVIPGGRVHLLEISEADVKLVPSMTRAEITGAFGEGWSAPEISTESYAVTTGDIPAWLVTVRREGEHDE